MTPVEVAQCFLNYGTPRSMARQDFLLAFADELPDPDDAHWLRGLGHLDHCELRMQPTSQGDRYAVLSRLTGNYLAYNMANPLVTVPLSILLRANVDQIDFDYTKVLAVDGTAKQLALCVSDSPLDTWTQLFRLVLPDNNNRLPVQMPSTKHAVFTWLSSLLTSTLGQRNWFLRRLIRELPHQEDRDWLTMLADRVTVSETATHLLQPEVGAFGLDGHTTLYYWQYVEGAEPNDHKSLPLSLMARVVHRPSLFGKNTTYRRSAGFDTREHAYYRLLDALFSPLPQD